jgi:lipoyl(octanoyl) transferase
LLANTGYHSKMNDGFWPSLLEWRRADGLVPYDQAVAVMEERAAAIRHAGAPELVWLVEHPPLYTAGTSAQPADLIDPDALPVFKTGRGGQYTYHGPGQRVAYVMLDLDRPELGQNRRDVRGHVRRLEEWMILTLARFGITGERRDGRVGIWVATGGGEAKIAAIGVRVRRWVTYHGVALNIAPDLSHYAGIVPCGIRGYGVTSMEALGIETTMAGVDAVLRATFAEAFEIPSPALREREGPVAKRWEGEGGASRTASAPLRAAPSPVSLRDPPSPAMRERGR